jgi:prepilin-type N-terminal cleavage/methylation domain-containing protein
MRAPSLRNRAGFTLPEVLIALTLTAVIGAAVTGVMVNQSRLFDQQDKLGNARQVSRSAMNILMAELRMVEVGGGIVAASPDSITVDVPYAMGLICGASNAADRTVVSLLPVDSAMFAEAAAGFSGWAHRTGLGNTDGYTYNTGTPRSIAEVTPPVAPCSTQGIVTLAGGRILRLQPYVASAPVGAPMFLYQRITYRFGPSSDVPGRRALWRRVEVSGVPEELVAPFDSTARFRFFAGTAQAATDSPPGTLSTLRGVELVLTGQSERPSRTGTADVAQLRTAVFFKNRPD